MRRAIVGSRAAITANRRIKPSMAGRSRPALVITRRQPLRSSRLAPRQSNKGDSEAEGGGIDVARLTFTELALGKIETSHSCGDECMRGLPPGGSILRRFSNVMMRSTIWTTTWGLAGWTLVIVRWYRATPVRSLLAVTTQSWIRRYGGRQITTYAPRLALRFSIRYVAWKT